MPRTVDTSSLSLNLDNSRYVKLLREHATGCSWRSPFLGWTDEEKKIDPGSSRNAIDSSTTPGSKQYIGGLMLIIAPQPHSPG